MSEERRSGSMRIHLTGERRERVLAAIRKYFAEVLDEPLSEFRAEQLLELFVRELGPPVYNQAIRDAHRFFEEKLVDLEGEFYEPEEDDGA